MGTYRNTLEIGHDGKGVPYGGSGEREDGTENHGFKNVKSDLSLVAQIPELAADPALRALVWAINQPDNGLLSVGCASYDVDEARGHRRTGFIDFAFNSKSTILDALPYFALFLNFEGLLHTYQFAEDFAFSWVLESASFIDASVSGFTATIFLNNTKLVATAEEARARWDRSLGILTAFLSSVRLQPGEPIYSPEV